MPEPVRRYVEMEGLESWLWVLLWRKDKVLGMLGTSSRSRREFSPSETRVVLAVGGQLATTVEKIQLYEETRKAYDDLRRTQEQLLQSEKMSAVGQMISGVAHELNNPLTAILGYAQLLETEEIQPRVREYVQKLQKQAHRTQKIVQNLLSFSRQHKPQRVHADLRSVMEDTIALRDFELKNRGIVVERYFQEQMPFVVADPHQLEQVYLNIINNAADAMMESALRGVLSIGIFTDGEHVVTEFHDSGPGISDPKRVFDPFYTTKGVGKGTGLGLSICYGIVKEHGGEIAAENHPQGGALIRIKLPAAVGDKPVTESDRIAARREPQLSGRVLLVDAEQSVLDFERELLSAAGLQVVTLLSGDQAIELLRKDSFDVIFIDSKIAGPMNNEEVYKWIQDARPDLAPRTVLMLPSSSDADVRVFLYSSKILCLVKPFEVSDLLGVIRRVLRDTKPSPALS
jgi:two-component system NtrC family sensor kinase